MPRAAIERARAWLERVSQNPSWSLSSAILQLGAVFIVLALATQFTAAPAYAQKVDRLPSTTQQLPDQLQSAVAAEAPPVRPRLTPPVPVDTTPTNPDGSRAARPNFDVAIVEIRNRPTLRAIDMSYGMYCLADIPPPNATIVWACVALPTKR